jgi:glycosyltransferase involved in cell wall biosynthesis
MNTPVWIGEDNLKRGEEIIAAPSFVLVGRMLHSKGVVEFLSAASRLRERFPEARFVLVGGSRSDYLSANPGFVPAEKLRDLCSASGVEWVELQPPAKVFDYLSKATALVMPTSYPEGLPRVLLEAAALGVPSIASAHPGCLEFVHDGVNGLVLSEISGGELALAMERLIVEPGLRDTLGQQARRDVVRGFSESQVTRRYLRLYRSIAPEAGSVGRPSRITSPDAV